MRFEHERGTAAQASGHASIVQAGPSRASAPTDSTRVCTAVEMVEVRAGHIVELSVSRQWSALVFSRALVGECDPDREDLPSTRRRRCSASLALRWLGQNLTALPTTSPSRRAGRAAVRNLTS